MPRFPWSAATAVMRASAVVWLLLRLLLAAAPLVGGLPFLPYIGGVTAAILVAVIVPVLVLYDARRMSERVFMENLGLAEAVIGAVALASALSFEILLYVARRGLMGG